MPFKPLEFDGAELGDFTIRTCKDSHQLIEWSTYMGNCVSSYRGDIIAGKVIMCGLFRGKDLAYNLSLTPVGKKFRIQQLNCRYNKGYTPEDYALVESFLGGRNVLSGQKRQLVLDASKEIVGVIKDGKFRQDSPKSSASTVVD